MCHTVPQPVYFTWQCGMRYHDQWNLAMCHAVPQPVYFTWQCVIRYHNQSLSPSNMSYGTTTSVFHLAICYAVPRPVPFTWQCVMLHHDQCNLAICLTVPQPVYFIWKCVMWYHNQCISPCNVLYVTTTSAFYLTTCHALPQQMYFS
jgi:hypothetical protein